MKTTIQILNAGMASGKTHVYINDIALTGRKAVIGTQNHKLSVEIYGRLIEAGVPEDQILIISSKTHPNCTKAIRAAIKSGRHQVLVADHSVVLRHHPGAGAYDLIIDEAFKVDRVMKVKASKPDIQAAISVMFEGAISVDPYFYELRMTGNIALKIEQILKDVRTDEGLTLAGYSPKMVELCHAMSDPNLRIAVRAAALDSWKAGKSEYVNFHPTLKASVLSEWKSVCVAAANIPDQEFYNHWRHEADFVDHPLMTKLRDDIAVRKGHLIKAYFISEDFSSKRKLMPIYERVCDNMAVWLQANFPDQPFLFCVRKADEGQPEIGKALDRNGNRQSSSLRGVEEFKHLNIGAFLSPINPSTPEYNYKRQRHQMDGEALKAATVYEQQQQWMARLSMRDFDSEEVVHCIFLDRKSAMAFQSKMKCADPEFIDIGIPELRAEKKRAMTGAERVAKHKETEKMIKNDHEKTQQYVGFKALSWTNRKAKELTQNDVSWFDLGAQFESDANTYEPRSKSSSKMFREGDLRDPQKHTLVSNILSTKLLILDIDKVKADPKKLSDFLCENGWSHFIFNSFTSTPMEQRIRVVIGLSECVNAENYKRIVKLIQADIQVRFGDLFEIDDSCTSINNKFYSPCVSQFNAPLLLKRHVMIEGKFEARFLDVSWFLTRNQIEDSSTKTIAAHVETDVDQQTIDDVIDRWAVSSGQGKGGSHFYQAGVDLKKAGCSYGEVIHILTAHRHMFGHGQDRNAKAVADHAFANNQGAMRHAA